MDKGPIDEGDWTADRILDACGLACPLPVLKARKVLAGMKPGERLLVEATDAMAAIDIPHLCRQDSHSLIRHEKGAVLRFLISRGASER
jgi:tRNA 2-thiouridine synthesizing protein A